MQQHPCRIARTPPTRPHFRRNRSRNCPQSRRLTTSTTSLTIKAIGGVRMRFKAAAVVLLGPALLMGCCTDCATRADNGLAFRAIAGCILGNQVGKGSGRVLATVAGAVVGGIVGSEIGRALDRQDQMLAQE